MKPALSILPVNSDGISMHLLVELGSSGISFIWFTKDMSVEGIIIYNFRKNLQFHEMTGELDKIIGNEPLSGRSAQSVLISYDFPESMLIPASYYDPATASDSLSLIYGDYTSAVVKTDIIENGEIRNCYRIDCTISEWVRNRFPGAAEFHSSSLQLKRIAASFFFGCTVFHNAIKVILVKNGKLQIIKQFNYTTPADISYYLLSICRQYGLDPGGDKLTLNGMIEEQSNLYDELYKYFANIVFDAPGKEVFLTEEIKKYPPHFFSNLTGLITCA